MFKNYLKIALRHLFRNKGFSFINITGLAVGIACSLLIILYIQDECSYDKFNTNADRIFRVVASTSEDGIPTNANGIFGTGPALKRDFPEVLDYVRIRKMGQGSKRYVGYEDKKFYEEWFFFADSSIFTVFTFPLIKGDAKKALVEPNSIVITEAMANKYFPDVDPMGKTIETDPYNTGEMMYFKVTGIAKNVPHNSHFHFDFLASYVNQKEDLTSFNGFWQHYTYVFLNQKTSAKTLEPKLYDFLQRNWRQDPWYTIHLQSLKDIRLHSHLRSEIESGGNIVYIYIFSAVALIVLLIACINFVNLTTARSSKRAKEVGLRKAVGAQRKQLITQFLGESILVSIVSGICSIALIVLLLPVFNNIAGKQVTPQYLNNPSIFIGLLGIIMFVGIISGSYVSFVLSSYKPIYTLKGILETQKSKGFLIDSLVIFQFVLSVTMIIATFTTQKQMNFIKEHSTGYNRDEILAIPLNKEAREKYPVLRNELLKDPNIRNTTTSSYVPTRGSMHNSLQFEGRDDPLSQVIYFIDKEFIDTYGIQLVAGKNTTRNISRLSDSEFLISELTVTEAGYNSAFEALGKRIKYGQFKGLIKGVVNNLNIYSFHQEHYAITFFVSPIENHNYLSICLNTENMHQTIAHIESVWQQIVPDYPLEYFFLDDSFEKMHRADQRLSEVFKYFGILAIIVACMGLFGMAVFTAEQRTKEIGIRKTLGAQVCNIYMLLSKQLVKWVLLANIVAWPIAWFIMNRWLQNFAFRTNIDIWTFVLPTFILFIIALLTVSWQTIRAALANPIESLRYE